MLLTSLPFLFRFLPVFLILYYGLSAPFKGNARVQIRLVIMLLGSMLFYLGGFSLSDPYSILLLLLSVVFNYMLSLMIGSGRNKTEKKFFLVLAVLFNTGVLCMFKYLPLVIHSDSLQAFFPLGLSFYTFSAISYNVDVYRGQKAEANPLYFANYLMFFPKVLQGPISRYPIFRQDLAKMEQGIPADSKEVEKGISFFILGLALQGVLSSKIGALWTQVWSWGPYGVGTVAAWMGAWGYSFQLYFDFFGYSLMALGLARAMGFTLPENFDAPYASTSAADFWRRWHASLGAWFRDYIYIPLGGSKRGVFRLILSTFVTWLITGLWHGTGWNFLIWAGLFFVLILIERAGLRKLFKKVPFLGHIYMLILIPISWMIFNIADLPSLFAYLKVMLFIPLEGSSATSILSGFQQLIISYWWLLLICIVFATPYPKKLIERFASTWVCRILMLALFWFAVWLISRSGSNPFMYLKF